MCDEFAATLISAPARRSREISPERYVNYEVTRQILWSVPLVSFARPGAGCFNQGIVEAAGIFGFPITC